MRSCHGGLLEKTPTRKRVDGQIARGRWFDLGQVDPSVSTMSTVAGFSDRNSMSERTGDNQLFSRLLTCLLVANSDRLVSIASRDAVRLDSSGVASCRVCCGERSLARSVKATGRLPDDGVCAMPASSFAAVVLVRCSCDSVERSPSCVEQKPIWAAELGLIDVSLRRLTTACFPLGPTCWRGWPAAAADRHHHRVEVANRVEFLQAHRPRWAGRLDARRHAARTWTAGRGDLR